MLHSSIKETDLTRNAITGDSVHVLAEAFLASHPILPSAIGDKW